MMGRGLSRVVWENPNACWLNYGHLGLVLQLQGSVLIVVKSGHMTDCSDQGTVADRYWQEKV